jgi:hypothetical protein
VGHPARPGQLAELTAAGELVNQKDKKGYRLTEWRKDDTPCLF